MKKLEFNDMQMPTLFIGHGSPMNALAENSYSTTLRELGENLPQPKVILCISAHWTTKGTWVTGMPNPKTIHDFYGFPKELFTVNYNAPGSPDTAQMLQELISNPEIQIDLDKWGLDHGTWSVLKHLYPKANIPTIQLSLDLSQPPQYHFELGKLLQSLRSKGVLIIGSGNIVHNLSKIQWGENPMTYAWAMDFDQWVKEKILMKDYDSLISQYLYVPGGSLSVPTTEHYYPLLYVLGAVSKEDKVQFFCEEMQLGSISMRSMLFY